MKDWNCIKCEKGIAQVEDNFEYEYCCSGSMCGCMGWPINPVLCDDCWNEKNQTLNNPN